MSKKRKDEANSRKVPFEQKAEKNSKLEWQKTGYLERAEMLLFFKSVSMDPTKPESDRERIDAVADLRDAVCDLIDMQIPGEVGDYGEDHFPPKEAVENKFLSALAKRLIMPKPREGDWITSPETNEEAQKLKTQALKFLSDVVDHMFKGLLKNKKTPLIRASQAIPSAFKYCQEIDRLPTKKELADYLKNLPEGGFHLNPTDYREMLKLAGLDGLPENKAGRPRKE